jgi:gamma-glutamylputrescine oxidase
MTTPTGIYDVAIVGAGIAGALAAHHLAEASLSVVVLEAAPTSGGIVDRGLGLALLGTPSPYVTLQARLGEETARKAWDLTRENLQLLTDTLEAQGVEATTVGSLRPTADDEVAEALRQSLPLLKQDLYSVELEDAEELGYSVALRTMDDIAFDPLLLIQGLLDHPNITVAYEAEVQAIKPASQPVDEEGPVLAIWARKHYVWAKGAILAGGAHGVRLSRSLGSVISPQRIHIVDFQTERSLPTPLVLQGGHIVVQRQGDLWRAVGWSNSDDAVTDDAVTDDAALSRLAEVGARLFPEATVVQRRSVWVARSRDGMPVVGKLPDLPHVYTVSGLGACGLSWASVAVDRLMALMIHDEAPGALHLERLFGR